MIHAILAGVVILIGLYTVYRQDRDSTVGVALIILAVVHYLSEHADMAGMH